MARPKLQSVSTKRNEASESHDLARMLHKISRHKGRAIRIVRVCSYPAKLMLHIFLNWDSERSPNDEQAKKLNSVMSNVFEGMLKPAEADLLEIFDWYDCYLRSGIFVKIAANLP